MSSPTLVRLDNVSKRFILHKDKSLKERLVNFSTSRKHRDDFWALQDVNFDIDLGTTVGLVGHNGSGKSTLLKVIGGILQPTTGTVARRGRLAALLELGAGFHQDLTGRENVYLNAAILGLSRNETEKVFEEIVDFSGIESFIDTQVKFYSSGMYVRLAFAVAVHVDPDLLLVDEVLAVGDEPFQLKCMQKIAQFQSEGRTIVLVSHSADQVGTLCDRVLVLHGGLVLHDGDPAEGIRILRKGYETDRKADPHLPETGAPYMFKSVSADTRVTERGVDVDVHVRVEIHDPQPDWGIGLSIDTPLGATLYAVTTFDMDVSLPNVRGVHDVTFTFPNVSAGAGKYIFNFGIGNRSGTNWDQAPASASFEMPPTSIGHGILRLEPTVVAH